MSARRLAVIVLLLGMMFGLRLLSGSVVVGEPIGESVILTIGFVVLAAYALAELTSGLGLPRVTGYILAGVAAGPSAAERASPAPTIL